MCQSYERKCGAGTVFIETRRIFQIVSHDFCTTLHCIFRVYLLYVLAGLKLYFICDLRCNFAEEIAHNI